MPMLSAGHHVEYVAQLAGELVPLAEATFPVLRRPLAKEMRRLQSFLLENVKSDAQSALLVYGKRMMDAQPLASIEIESRDELIAELDRFTERLEKGDRNAVRELFQMLVSTMAAAIDLQGRVSQGQVHWRDEGDGVEEAREFAKLLDLSIADVRTAVRGDTAFRALFFVLEIASAAMESVRSRGMVAVRAA